MQGLSSSAVRQRLLQFGYNELPEKKEYRTLKILFGQFASFLIIILIVAGTVSYFLDEKLDAFAIWSIVILNAIIGFFQEYKAENAVAALKKLVIPHCVVMRDGEKKQIPIRELVPGDLVILAEGDKIPADLEIIEGFSVRVDQAVLTGESVPVNKIIGDQLFKGTIISTGHCQAVVKATGAQTEFGKIVNLVSKQGKTRSPLSIQLDKLGHKLGIIILIIIGILFILGELQGISWVQMFMTSVALGVSAIPEGMPIIVTLTLAMGVQTLAHKRAIVRKMNSIETLGATTIICSDKTGTLTLNEMTVKHVYYDSQDQEIPGLGYDWKTTFKATSPVLKKLCQIAENCNNAFIGKALLGDPTEIALKIMARKARCAQNYNKLDEIVFSSERKMMSTLHKIGSKKEIFAKGAFEQIIAKSTHILLNNKVEKLSAIKRKQLQKQVEDYSSQALRVLAFAYKPYGKEFNENQLIFVGLAAMIDPPRKTVKHSIALAQQAGIRVKIITGDNPLTAQAIGKRIGLQATEALTGDDLDKLSDAQLSRVLMTTQIFARTKPEHKYRIVDLLKKQGEVVAVTGDGVNDAPALKHADVGVAMGIKGTEATKEVADIILKDDNFSTIVRTIEEGRRIYNNILAFLKYLLSANFSTLLDVGLLTIFGFPLPILALQILWINLATDALPALALGFSKAESNLMNQPPHPQRENILHRFKYFIIITLILKSIGNLVMYFYGMHLDAKFGINTANLSEPSYARTMFFTGTICFEMVLALVCKSSHPRKIWEYFNNSILLIAILISLLLQLLMIYTPLMQEVFRTLPLGPIEWLLIATYASTAFLVPRLAVWIKR